MFYDKLQEILKKKKISNAKLAEQIGVNKSSFTQWKNGSDPGIKKLIAICKYLDITPNELLGFDEDPPDQELSDEEKTLLENFRASSTEGKETIMHMVALTKQLPEKGKSYNSQPAEEMNERKSS